MRFAYTPVVADKASKPLFELMGRARPEGEVRDEAGTGPGAAHVRVPVVAVWTGVAAALGVVVLTWAVAYSAGVSAGKAAMAAEQGPRELDGLRIADPVSDNRDAPGGDADRSGGQGPEQAGGSGGAAGRVLTASGWARTDPRVRDTNYLELATLSEASAEAAIAYLAEANIRVIGVPKEGGGVTLYSVDVAIPSGEWARMRAQGEAHQRRVSQVGARWQRDERGESDFSKSYWRKYEG